jgi:replicative DNA helicase
MIDESTLQDPAAEQGLMGALGHHPDALAPVLARLAPGAFYDVFRGDVWAAARVLAGARSLITPITLARELRRGGVEVTSGHRDVLTRQLAAGGSVETADLAAELIEDLAARRELARTLKRAEQLFRDASGDTAEILGRIQGELAGLTPTDEHTGTLTWDQLLDEFESAHEPGAPSRAIPTPWYELDELIGGLHPGRVYTIGGATNSGKSTVAINMMACAANLGKSVLGFSWEMPSVDVMGRLVAGGAEVDLSRINNRRLTDRDREAFAEYRKRTAGHRVRINSSAGSMREVADIARAVQHRDGLDLLVVDYLQLMSSGVSGRTAEEEIAAISMSVKILARKLDIPVVIPAQLNRSPAARADQRPVKTDLRGSGRIEQDSDAVILLHQPVHDGEPDPHNRILIVDKNRQGPKGDVTLRWRGAFGVLG